MSLHKDKNETKGSEILIQLKIAGNLVLIQIMLDHIQHPRNQYHFQAK